MQVSSQYANKLGKVFPDAIFFCKNVLIGYNGEKKFEIFEELVQGLMSRGINVYNMGNISYSQFNFACSFYNNDGAIYISDTYTLLGRHRLLSNKKIKKLEKQIEKYKWKEEKIGDFIPLPIIEDYELEMNKEIHFSEKTIQINIVEDLEFLNSYVKLIKKSKTEIKKSKKLGMIIENDIIRFFQSGEIFPESILPKIFIKFQKSPDLSPLIGGKYSDKIVKGGNSEGQYFFKNLKLSSPILALIQFLNKDIKKTEDIFITSTHFENSLHDLKKELLQKKISCKLKLSRLYNNNWFTAILKNKKLIIRGLKEEVIKVKKVANGLKHKV